MIATLYLANNVPPPLLTLPTYRTTAIHPGPTNWLPHPTPYSISHHTSPTVSLYPKFPTTQCHPLYYQLYTLSGCWLYLNIACEWLPRMLKVAGSIPSRGCNDLYRARGSQGVIPIRVGITASQLDYNYYYYYYLKRLAMQGQEREIDTLSVRWPQPHTTNL